MSSEGAKGGFQAETNFINLVNNEWKTSSILKSIFHDMNIEFDNVEHMTCEKPIKHNVKTDCFILISYLLKNDKNIHNISIKLVSSKLKKGFNQIDKRWIKSYAELLNIPDDIVFLLKLYTGEKQVSEYPNKPQILKDKKQRRLFADEMIIDDQKKLVKWFNENINAIFTLVFVGNDIEYQPNFMLLIKGTGNNIEYKIHSITDAINFYKGDSKSSISGRGNFHLGKLTIQRKGGDKGKDTAKQLQFKFDPLAIWSWIK